MAYINVQMEVDTDDFDTEDLIDSLRGRKFSKDEKRDIAELLDYKIDKYIYEPEGLLDEMKLDIILANYKHKDIDDIKKFFES